MQVYHGKSVFGGVAVGKIRVYRKEEKQVRRRSVEDPETEIARFHDALEEAMEQLAGLYDKAVREVGESGASVFEVHRMMLEDEDFTDSVENRIRTERVNAEYAAAATGDDFANMFEAMDDEYMKGRAADIRDISERLLGILTGASRRQEAGDEPVILVAEDLAPSETVQMDKSRILAFVTVRGSLNSHTAILARTMGIPALVGTELGSPENMEKMDGKTAAVDGRSGLFYLEPEGDVLKELEEKRKEYLEKKELLETLKGKETVTRDGRYIRLYANIGNSRDLAAVMQNDAAGIGLFRSEFIYLERDHLPTEDEQYQIYKMVLQTMADRPVIIRTLDIGADKQCSFINMEEEENPAMGLRAIRICLSKPDIFRTQLRALFRAGIFGKLSIMYPMITSVEEVRQIRKIAEEVKRELTEQGLSYADVEQGIMIETPAAAVISDLLAEEVDFFSIGTNDLSQYTLAMDRQNSALDPFFDPRHPAILRLIELTIKNAHEKGIWVGICGELGGDASLTETFLAMGVDELSVSPGRILPIRKTIREMDLRMILTDRSLFTS
ncbi:MAG: phosphoenolpyruvate--protein phosphotransferase [Lachnospiraceae bacterium]|nr:phosphoenolpyruvate--protein phosphotransferase [Lachnospiraceae bacterium]